MKIKDIFKKVETYNELAEIMQTTKVQISFGEKWHSEKFDNFNDFKKYIRHEYVKDIVDGILNSEDWEIDGEIEIEWEGRKWKYFAELVSKW